jgi:hypothetical protein
MPSKSGTVTSQRFTVLDWRGLRGVENGTNRTVITFGKF